MTRSNRDRLILQISKPTPDPLYTFINPSFNVISKPDLLDPETGFLVGARQKDAELTNKTAKAVIALLQSSDPIEKLAFDLVGTVTSDNCDLIGAIVLHLGLTNALWGIDVVKAKILSRGLTNAVRHAPRTPTDPELDAYHEWAEVRIVVNQPVDEANRQIADALLNGDFYQFQATIRDVVRYRDRNLLLGTPNPAIDRDRRELFDRLARLKIDEQVRSQLDLADRTAERGDFKGAMEKTRTFLERSIEHCCLRYQVPAGKNAPPAGKAGGSIGPWLQWAEHVGLLKKTEHELIQALYGFLSMEGAHAATSQARQYAIAKAMVIESCLLVADRIA